MLAIREDLHELPGVSLAARKLNSHPAAVVGYLVRLWSYMARHGTGGTVEGTVESIELSTNLPSLLGVLEDAGLVLYVDGKLSSLNYAQDWIASAREDVSSVFLLSSSSKSIPYTEEEEEEEKKIDREDPNTDGAPNSKKPTLDEILLYSRGLNYQIDGPRFLDWYEPSKGDWRRAVDAWKAQERDAWRVGKGEPKRGNWLNP